MSTITLNPTADCSGNSTGSNDTSDGAEGYYGKVSGNEWASWLKFDLSPYLAAGAVSNAKLRLYYTWDGATLADQIDVYRVRRSDVACAAGTSWNNYKTGSAWGSGGGRDTTTDIDASTIGSLATVANEALNVYKEIPLNATMLAQMMAGGSWSANGANATFMLRSANSVSAVGYGFATLDAGANMPQLVFDYVVNETMAVTEGSADASGGTVGLSGVSADVMAVTEGSADASGGTVGLASDADTMSVSGGSAEASGGTVGLASASGKRLAAILPTDLDGTDNATITSASVVVYGVDSVGSAVEVKNASAAMAKIPGTNVWHAIIPAAAFVAGEERLFVYTATDGSTTWHAIEVRLEPSMAATIDQQDVIEALTTYGAATAGDIPGGAIAAAAASAASADGKLPADTAALLANLDAAVSTVGGRPQGWVSITPDTQDDSNVALGVAQVSGVDTAGVVIAALLDGLAKNVTTSDGDGGYDLPVPPGATYTVRYSWDGPDGAASLDRVVTV